MAKYADPLVAAAAAKLATGTQMYYCAGQPVSQADAVARATGPAIALAPGDFTIATPSAGVRTVTIAAKSETVTVAETTDHIAVTDGTTLLFVDTAPAQATNVGATESSGAIVVTLGPIA